MSSVAGKTEEMQAKLKVQWEQAMLRFNALSLRERALVGVAILSVLFAFWSMAVEEPMARNGRQLQQQIEQAQSRAEALAAAMAAISARAGIDANREVRGRLLQLQAQMDALMGRQKRLNESFISPEAIADLLRDMLAHHRSLRLLSLQTAEPRSLMEREKPQAGNQRETEVAPAIYRHEMTLEIEGNYFDVMDYLRALEPLALFWESLDYEVQAHPLARVRLKVYTLSFGKEWLRA